MRKRTAIRFSWTIAASAALVCAVHAADTLVQLDGRSVSDRSISAINQNEVRYGDQTFDLMALRRIDRPADGTTPHPARPAAVQLSLRDGSRLNVQTLRIEQQHGRIGWAWRKDWSIPLDDVRAILLQPPADDKTAPRTEYRQALDRQTNEDVILVVNNKQLLSVGGALVGLDDQQVTVLYHDQPRRIDRKKVYAIVLGGTRRPVDLTGQAQVYLAEGSRLWGRLDKLTGDVLTVRRTSGPAVALPWSAVRRIDIRSDRMVWLSQLEPVEVDDRPLFVLGGWERDRSWLGRPLSLGGQVYERGLGVHAPCRLVYEPAGRFDRFAAVIGIDDETHRQNGDCLFKVIADGRTIYQQRVTCTDAPRPIRLDIAKVKRLTLQVDYGENLDIGDHADWADARFIRHAGAVHAGEQP